MVAFVIALLLPQISWAQQEVTVREINEIGDDAINSLNQQGAALTDDVIADLIFNDLDGESVQFTAVVMSDPLQSGLASPDDSGEPGRLHVFVRDTSAVSQGLAGMGIQLVDGASDYHGLDGYGIGDVITITGEVSPFNNTLQVSPSAVSSVGFYQDLNLPDSLLGPVPYTTAEINKAIADNYQVEWTNLPDMRGQFVRIESATVVDVSFADEGRPDWYITTDGGQTVVPFYDTSLRYRNDQSDYSDRFDVREEDFVPPPPGSVINIQGFLALVGDATAFNLGVPAGAIMSIIPFDDVDLEVVETPPIITDLSKPDFVPGTDPVEITVDVAADEARTIGDVTLDYYTSAADDTTTLTPTSTSGTTYTFTIPAVEDGVFVSYYVEASDNTGATSTSDPRSYRVLTTIDEIADIQTTIDEGPGDSPFAGITISDMDITATVQSNPPTSELIAIQDVADLSGWSGILIAPTETLLGDLQQGDVINITAATVQENFGVTELTNVTYTKESTGGASLGYKEVPTSALADRNVAEAHEGMLLRFNDVTIVSDSLGFGEWSFTSTDDEADAVAADDASAALTEGFSAETFEPGDQVDFIQGIWWYSFGVYKLVPEDPQADFGSITTDVEDGVLAGRFTLDSNYPNPFSKSTTIRFNAGQTARAQLEVFDVLGRRVATLVDELVPAGPQDVTLQADDLPSGLYLYRLTVGEQTQTRKMLIVR